MRSALLMCAAAAWAVCGAAAAGDTPVTKKYDVRCTKDTSKEPAELTCAVNAHNATAGRDEDAAAGRPADERLEGDGADKVVNATLCTITVTEGLNVTGWDNLTFSAPLNVTGFDAADVHYAMGYGEAYLTYQRIYQTLRNWGVIGTPPLNTSVTDWLSKHKKYMHQLAGKKNGDEYEVQLGRLLAQLDGLYAGYAAGCKANKCSEEVQGVNDDDLFLLNFYAELSSLNDAAEAVGNPNSGGLTDPVRIAEKVQNGHCSALVKITEDDVFFGHATWTSYNTMMRQFKTYTVGNVTIMMSGYPGLLSSVDDFYMTSWNLTVMETTNEVFDWKKLGKTLIDNPSVVSTFLRVMIANYIGATPAKWAAAFAKHNSGTYNNQWMVLNMGAVDADKLPKLPKGAFYVLETLPGMVEQRDVTDELVKNGYWASYNSPYFSKIAYETGAFLLQGLFGKLFSYSKQPRAEMFRRNHTKVHDVASMNKLMQYNDFEHDNLSLIPTCQGAPDWTCKVPRSAMLAIASRLDLDPKGGREEYGDLYAYFRQSPFGAIDFKTTSYTMMMEREHMSVIARSGPTHDQQPVFKWSTSPWAKSALPHRFGLPDAYDFGPVTFEGGPLRDVGQRQKRRIIVFVLAGIGGAVVIGVGFVFLGLSAAKQKPGVDDGDYLRIT